MQWQRKLPPPLLQEESPPSRLCASAEQPFPISVFFHYTGGRNTAQPARESFFLQFPRAYGILYLSQFAGVLELVDEVDSKSIGLIPRAGSIPATGTKAT